MKSRPLFTLKRPRTTKSLGELDNLAADPREEMNLWGQPAAADVQARLLADLLAFLVSTSDITPAFEDPRGLPASPAPPFPWPPTTTMAA